MKKRVLIFIFAFLFLINLVSAPSVSVGTSDMTRGRVVWTPPIPTNLSTIFVDTIDTSAFVNCSTSEVFLGNGSCLDSDFFFDGGGSFTDTNASTECNNGEYLDGSGSCLNFNNTIVNLGSNNFLNLSGTNANQNINISPFDFQANNLTLDGGFFQNNYSIKQGESNTQIDGDVFMISFLEEGTYIPHFILQPGGLGQASVFARSLILANDNHSILGTVNQTSCQTWADSENFTLQIDCNSTSEDNPMGSGADLLIAGDIQIVGESWLRDTDGEWHFFSRELDIRDEITRNTTLTGINGTLDLSNNNLTIRTTSGNTIVVNIDKANKILASNSESIVLTEGTNESPVFNHIFYTDQTNPVLNKRATLSEDVPGVAAYLMGDNFVYASIVGATTGEDFIKGVYNRFLDDGSIYKSGFNFTVTTTGVNISNGTLKFLLETIDITGNHSTSDLFVHIHDNGDFDQHDALDDCANYNNGAAIGNNKYFNAVYGIAITNNGEGRMYVITQDEPNSEYIKALDAELDLENTINFFPSHDLVSLVFIPIVRVVMKRSGGVNTIQTLGSGDLFIDLRGTVTKASSSPPSTSGDNLGDHIMTQDIVMGEFNINGSGNFTGGYFFGDGSQLTGLLFAPNTTLGLQLLLNGTEIYRTDNSTYDTHVNDNSQAHTDYLKNDDHDETPADLTANTFKIRSGETYPLVLDTDNSEHTAERTLTFDVSNADRTILFQGNPTLDNWFNQDVQSTASPNFVEPVVQNLTLDLSTANDYRITERAGGLAWTNVLSGSSMIFEQFSNDGDATDSVTHNIFAKGTISSISPGSLYQGGYNTGDTSSFRWWSIEVGGGGKKNITLFTEGNTNQLLLGTGGEIFMPQAVNDALGNLRDPKWDSLTGQLGYDSSSIRYKENLKSLPINISNKVYELDALQYDKIDGEKNRMGFTAEQVAEYFPQCVFYKTKEFRKICEDEIVGEYDCVSHYEFELNKTTGQRIPEGINYDCLITPLIQESQNLNEREIILNQTIQNLKSENDLMKASLCKLGEIQWC